MAGTNKARKALHKTLREKLAKQIEKRENSKVLSPLPSSATVNIGLKDPVSGELIDADTALQGILDSGRKVADFRILQSGTEPTLVTRVDRPYSAEEGGALSSRLGQEAIAQKTDAGEGALFGPKAEEWGPFNQEYFLEHDAPGFYPEYRDSNLGPRTQDQMPVDPGNARPKTIATANRKMGALFNKQNRARLEDYVRKGMERQQAERWYWSGGIRDRFIEELGEDAGVKAFEDFMDFKAATSPRSTVRSNIRRASEFFRRNRQGEPMMGRMPPEYGHMMESTHRGALNRWLDSGRIADPNVQTKIARYAENLKGNYDPVTADTHFMKIVTGRSRKPSNAEYAAIQRYVSEEAARLGISPAEYQSALWAGAGDVTGVANTSNITPAMNRRIKQTAQELGITEDEAAKRFMRGDIRLRAAAPGGVGVLAAQDEE